MLASPFMGQLQSFLRRSLSTRNYVLLFGVGVIVAVGLAILIAFAAHSRAAGAAVRAAAGRAGVRRRLHVGDRDAVAGGQRRRARALCRVRIDRVPVLSREPVRRSLAKAERRSVDRHPADARRFMVGTLDEWLQWFIPVRVGEAHDVFLNLAAIVLRAAVRAGAAAAGDRSRCASRAASLAPHRHRRRRSCWLIFATFVSQVHLGHVDRRSRTSAGSSRITRAARAQRAAGRSRRAMEDASRRLTLRRLSREDQYLDEGVWHVRRRNVDRGRGGVAREPDSRALLRAGARHADLRVAARQSLAARAARRSANAASARAAMDFISAAEPYPIVAWPKGPFWMLALVLAALLAAVPAIRSSR